VVCAIPRGRVSTYGAVARAADCPVVHARREFALRVAPEALNLPWHRVVGAGGRIVFPKSSREHKEQARRLHAEGLVQNGRVTLLPLRTSRSCSWRIGLGRGPLRWLLVVPLKRYLQYL